MKVAVYGTLKQGFGNHRLISTAEFLGTHRVSGFVMRSLGGFPAVHRGEGEITIETYECSPEQLESMDRLEGHPRWYRREEITVAGDSYWIYLMPEEEIQQHSVVEGGTWPRT